MTLSNDAGPGDPGNRDTRLEENSAVLAAFGFPPAKPTGPAETVIVVEDEAALRGLIRLTLQAKGYRVLEAKDGIDAIALCEVHPGPIHLLITDVVMPGMAGPTLADRLTFLRPELRVLYLSGYHADALSRYGLEETRVHFMRKPFSMTAIGSKVRELLEIEGG